MIAAWIRGRNPDRERAAKDALAAQVKTDAELQALLAGWCEAERVYYPEGWRSGIGLGLLLGMPIGVVLAGLAILAGWRGWL